MKVSVVYAEPLQQVLLDIDVPEGSTVQTVIDSSGLCQRFPTIDIQHVGIFGKQVTLKTRVADGDRIEIYRPLPNDPKLARQKRAERKKPINKTSL